MAVNAVEEIDGSFWIKMHSTVKLYVQRGLVGNLM